jgi:hypothetical protein
MVASQQQSDPSGQPNGIPVNIDYLDQYIG